MTDAPAPDAAETFEQKVIDLTCSTMGFMVYKVSESELKAARARLISAHEDAVRELVEGLKPFADLAAHYDPPEDDDDIRVWDRKPTLGELRAARALIEKYGVKL